MTYRMCKQLGLSPQHPRPEKKNVMASSQPLLRAYQKVVLVPTQPEPQVPVLTWFSVKCSLAASWALFFPTRLCCFANTFSSSSSC